MAALWAVSSWDRPDLNPRAHAAGLAAINAFYDSAPASPTISAAAAPASQPSADAPASQRQVAAAGGEQAVAELAVVVGVGGGGRDVSAPMGGVERPEGAAVGAGVEPQFVEMAESERISSGPMLLPSPMPDGTIEPSQHLPSSGIRSIFSEMRGEEQTGHLPRHAQRLPLDSFTNARNFTPQIPYPGALDLDEILKPIPAFSDKTWVDAEKLRQANSYFSFTQDDDETEPAETSLHELARHVAMGGIADRSLAWNGDVRALHVHAEDANAQDAMEFDLYGTAQKRGRNDSAIDSLLLPASKRAKTSTTEDDETEAEPDESATGARLPASEQSTSIQVGKARTQGTAAENPPATQTTTGNSSSPLTDLSNTDAPSGVDYVTPTKPTKPHHVVSKSELASLCAGSVSKKVNVSPRKTRQQKQADEAAKPNASAAVKRRRSGLSK